jgi:hypothetical protein
MVDAHRAWALAWHEPGPGTSTFVEYTLIPEGVETRQIDRATWGMNRAIGSHGGDQAATSSGIRGAGLVCRPDIGR